MKLFKAKVLITSALVIAFGLFYYYTFYMEHGRNLLPLYHLRMALVQYAASNGSYPESLDALDTEALLVQPFTYQYKFHYLAKGIDPAGYDETIPLLLAYDSTSPVRFLFHDSGKASFILDGLDKMGRTALHAADADATRFLLAEGNIESDHRDNSGTTPLSIASSRGNIHVVRLLLASGANPNIADNNGVTPLCYALAGGIPLRYVHTSECDSDFPAVIRALVEAGAEYDVFSATALGNKEYLIKALDTHPQVVYAKGLNGFTLLHVAASHNNIDIAKLLLEHGADPLAKCDRGATPMSVAVSRNLMNMALLLEEYGCHIDLSSAAALGMLERLQSILEDNPRLVNSGSMPPLHEAVISNREDIVQLLLKSGANVNLRAANTMAPMDYARSARIAAILIEYGGDVNSKGEFLSSTPLLRAVQRGDPDLVRVLLEAGADVNGRGGSHAQTPLHAAASQGELRVVEILLEAGADVNLEDRNGFRALHLAASQQSAEVLQLLLDSGADINATSNNMTTALDIAAIQGDLDIYTFLLLAGGESGGGVVAQEQ